MRTTAIQPFVKQASSVIHSPLADVVARRFAVRIALAELRLSQKGVDPVRSEPMPLFRVLDSLGSVDVRDPSYNGTGLMLATATLSDHPALLLPMIFYTLVQQFVAALVDWKLFKSQD